MKKQLIELRVNGRTYELAVEPNKLLLDVLRQDLDLTGSKRGCDDSSCGACTVQVDGIPMLACTMLAASFEGHEITTVEGFASGAGLAALQKAYGDFGGAQCGYCTPGLHDDRQVAAGQQSRSQRAGDSRSAEQQSVPLHRLYADVSGHSRRHRCGAEEPQSRNRSERSSSCRSCHPESQPEAAGSAYC